MSLRVLLARLAGMIGRRHSDGALNHDIEAHLELLAEDYVRRGMSRKDARDAARRAFGGVEQVKAVYRDQRGFPGVDALTQDVRFAMRLLLRHRGFAVTALLVLGVGIGVNNMMFTLIYSLTMRGLPIDRADRVLHVSTFDQRFPDRPLSYAEFDEIRREARNFTGIAAFVSGPVAVGEQGRAPDRFDATYLTPNAFALVGAQPTLGRVFAIEEDGPGAPPLVVLGSRAWRLRYNADTGILGKSILIDGAPATVIGVMPDPSGFPSSAEVWLPLSRAPDLNVDKPDVRTLRVFGRVRDDASIADARAEVEAIIERVARRHPESSQGVKARVVPINERFFGSPTQTAWLAFSAAALVIVIVSCANAANLMLARSVLRAREIAIRGSLGASRWRVVRQLLIESLMLAGLSGAAGLLISLAGVQLFRTAIPENAMPYWFVFTMDTRVFAALVAVSCGTVLLFGFVPALQASKADINRVLRDGGRSHTGGGGARRWTTAFLVAQFALSVVLLAQMVVSIKNQQPRVASDEVVNSQALLTAAITLPAAKYPTPDQRNDFYRRLEERLGGLAGVSMVSIASVVPLRGAVEQRLDVEGRTELDGEQARSVWTVSIGPRYFTTLGVPLKRGREFSEQDGPTEPFSAIVNERFVELYFDQSDPIGRRIRVRAPSGGSDAAWRTISGVAQDVRQRNFADPDPIVYLPFRSAPVTTASLVVRSSVDATTTAAALRREAMAVDPNLPLYRVMTMSQVIEEAQWNGRVSHRLITMLTIIALALAVVGLYAVTAHAVGLRTQEIGVRMALGARSGQVRMLILRRAILQVAIGLGFGIVGTVAWSRAFSSGQADLSVASIGVIAPIAALLAVVTFPACLVPARRATRLDPVAALRQE
jgi:predicted permease